MKLIVRSVLLLFSVGMLAGCFSPVKTPLQSTYFFNPDIEIIKARQTRNTILVSRPVAAAGYTTYRMAYTKTPSELSYYTRNRWIAPPAEMLQPLLVESIQRSKRFRAVAQAPFTGKTVYRLDTDLVYIRQNLIVEPHQMEIALQVRLVDNNNQRIIASRLFKRSCAVLELAPYDGVLTSNEVLQQLLSDVTRFVIYNTKR